MKSKPSRTYNLGLAVIVANLLLALGGTLATLFAPADAVPHLADLLTTIAICIAGGGGGAAGGMALRDSASGGLTSSQGEIVAAAQRATVDDGPRP